MIASVRSYLAEPAVPDPPARVWRDWALVGAATLGAALEVIVRRDEAWTGLGIGWRIAAVVTFAVSVPPALLMRRTHPLAAMYVGFLPNLVYGTVTAAAEGSFGGLTATSVVLVVPYALFRWGSGRDGAIGALVMIAIAIAGNATDPTVNGSDWIGGFVVMAIPVLAGLAVRYRTAGRDRAMAEIKSREREELARELHDSVAHHVSAIAIQARAGRAVGTTDPARALDILRVIEEAASSTLAEMRAIVTTLRDGDGADLAPRRGVADLRALAGTAPSGLRIAVEVDEQLGPLEPAIDTAIYRIARESATNAVRHARHASQVRVAVGPDGDGVCLHVVDDGSGAIAPTADGVGHGLLGMAERAHLVGGHLDAGPTATGGWRVLARLPRQPAPGGTRS
ncbi:MAG: sensor histidine kinase [Desertimonas sp.]